LTVVKKIVTKIYRKSTCLPKLKTGDKERKFIELQNTGSEVHACMGWTVAPMKLSEKWPLNLLLKTLKQYTIQYTLNS
jgi:hypothetical protein